LKNLSHMRFGRMEKRFNANIMSQLLSEVESMTGKSLSTDQRQLLAKGADEVDLVRSGLEETMINSYKQIRAILDENPEVKDMRTAAFVVAIKKIGSDYNALGIFP